MKLSEIRREAIARLSPDPHATREVDALLSFVLNQPRQYLFAWPEALVSPLQIEQFQALLARYASGEPAAYLLGQQDFYGRAFMVDARVLIPRPETEMLVDRALAIASRQTPLQVLDIGVGSGAIAITLCAECPAWQVVGVDTSEAALLVARQNAVAHDVQLRLLYSDVCASVMAEQFDVIVSNPPYIAETDVAVAPEVVAYEPHGALFAAQAGLAIIQKIIVQAKTVLKPGGWLLLEHGYQQQAAVVLQLQNAGFVAIETHQDTAGHPRMVVAQQPREHYASH